MKQAFELFDKNNDGTINLSEMKEVMKTLGRDPTEEELKGKEFKIVLIKKQKENCTLEVCSAFSNFSFKFLNPNMFFQFEL